MNCPKCNQELTERWRRGETWYSCPRCEFGEVSGTIIAEQWQARAKRAETGVSDLRFSSLAIHRPEDNYIPTCTRCGAQARVLMHAFRHPRGGIQGWLFVCEECASSVWGARVIVTPGEKVLHRLAREDPERMRRAIEAENALGDLWDPAGESYDPQPEPPHPVDAGEGAP